MKGKIPIVLAAVFGIIHCFSPISLSKTCLALSDNEQVGGTARSLVVNQNYLAFADTKSNLVIVYRRNIQGRWSESHRIAPPLGSTVAKHGGGFGYSIALDGNILIIGAFFNKAQPTTADRAAYPFILPNNNAAYGGAIYRTDVRKPASIQRIDQPKSGEIAGFSVAAHQGNVAFPVNYYDKNGVFSSYTTLVLGKTHKSINVSSGTVAMRNNILVIGNTSLLGVGGSYNSGMLSILDLKQLTQSPRRIETNFPVLGISISDQLIAATGSHQAWGAVESQQRALVISIKDEARHNLKGSGMVHVHRNLLVRNYPYTPDYENPGQIELFDFKDINKPRLIYSQKKIDIRDAQLNDQELFTIQGQKLCIESLPR